MHKYFHFYAHAFFCVLFLLIHVFHDYHAHHGGGALPHVHVHVHDHAHAHDDDDGVSDHDHGNRPHGREQKLIQLYLLIVL